MNFRTRLLSDYTLFCPEVFMGKVFVHEILFQVILAARISPRTTPDKFIIGVSNSFE